MKAGWAVEMTTTGSNPIASPFPPLELDSLDLRVVSSFFVESTFLHRFLSLTGLECLALDKLASIEEADPDSLMLAAFSLRSAMLAAEMPAELGEPLENSYRRLSAEAELSEALVTVRPEGASFHQGGRYRGAGALSKAVVTAFAEHLSRGVIQDGLRDLAEIGAQSPRLVVARALGWDCSGLVSTLEPKAGNSDFVVAYSTWGLADDIARKELARDEYTWHKPTLAAGYRSLVRRRAGNKEFRLDFDFSAGRMRHAEVPHERRREFTLTPEESHRLALAALKLESVVGTAVELDWGMEEGWSRQLHLLSYRRVSPPPPRSLKVFTISGHGEPLLSGQAVGTAVASGKVRVIEERSQLEELQPGEVLVARKTEPDWEPFFRQAAAIVTEADTRVSHATILAREMGIPAILGASGCTLFLDTGQTVTVSCCQGDTAHVYEGEVEVAWEEYDARHLPELKTKLMVSLSMPERAMTEARQPWAGAGLVRSEFIFTGWIRIHPLALLHPERLAPEVQGTLNRLCRGYSSKREYFLDQMAQAVATVASAFWPRPVVLRLSDLKSSEYARLVGGEKFEPAETNPALGFRGASRYLHPDYREAFELELEAIRRVRVDMGLTNLHLMIPFCRTPGEGEEVLEAMRGAGLHQGVDGLSISMMAELPSHVFLAEEFLELFDGMSIGSNDLTQMVLAVDRDNARVAPAFDELHPALMHCYERLIEVAHRAGKPIGFCGQVADEDPLFAATLAEMGIDSVSVPPDAFSKMLTGLRTS